MVAPGDERRARGRAKRRGVERIVTQPGSGQLVKGRRGNRTAESGRSAPAYVIGHDEEDIRRTLRCFERFREIWRGVRCRAANLAFEGLFWFGQDFLRPCR